MYVKNEIRGIIRNLAWFIFNKLENNNNPHFYKNGEKFFIEKLFENFSREGGKKVIFDIGANIGNYSSILLYYSEQKNVEAELHIFEPTQSCFKILLTKYGTKTNVILNNFGLSNVNTTAEIFYDKDLSGLASLYKRNLKHYNINFDKSEQIKLLRADEYIEKNKIKHISFIKIDVEGHELKVLEGLGNYLNADFIDYIQFEYGGANLDSHSSLLEIYEVLEKSNFVIAKIMPNGLEIRKYKPFMENFQYSNYVAISMRLIK